MNYFPISSNNEIFFLCFPNTEDGGAGGGENLSAEETNLLARITESAFSGAMFER